MGVKRADYQAIIAAPPKRCFDALTDYATIPDWQSSVKRCDVVEASPDGRPRQVRWKLDAKVRTVEYTLAYTYEEPSWIGYSYVEGDLADVEGEYTFEDRGDETTLATFSLRLDPGIWVPAPVLKILNDQVLKRGLDDLRSHIEASG